MSALFTTCELWTYVMVLWCYTFFVGIVLVLVAEVLVLVASVLVRTCRGGTRACTRSYCTRNIPEFHSLMCVTEISGSFTLLFVSHINNLSLLYLLNAGPFVPFWQPWVEVTRPSHREASIQWWLSDAEPPDTEDPAKWLIMLTKPLDFTVGFTACFFFIEGRKRKLYLPLLLTIGCQYRVTVAAMSHAFIDKCVPSFLVFAEGSLTFRAGTQR